jgi:hypothetical protein
MPEFLETDVFSDQLQELYDDHVLTRDGYRQLQNALLNGETRIDTIRGTGGLKKARWGTRTSGKSGGLRVIFYHHTPLSIYFLLLVYRKSEVTSLTSDQKKHLARVVDDLKQAADENL